MGIMITPRDKQIKSRSKSELGYPLYPLSLFFAQWFPISTEILTIIKYSAISRNNIDLICLDTISLFVWSFVAVITPYLSHLPDHFQSS